MRFFSYASALIIFAFSGALSGCSKIIPNPVDASKSATASSPVYSISISSGNNQSGIINGPLQYSFVAVVTDLTTNLPAVNVVVNWSVVSGGGSFASKYSNSSPSGTVSATLNLGSAVGANTVTATIAGTSKSVTFTATGSIGAPAAANCTIVGSSPVEPDGINFSTITITLKDLYNNVTAGYTPTFAATGSNNTYGVCSISNASGVSTCTLKSTTAETKILSLTSPVAKVGGAVVFAPGAVSAGNSTITGTGSVVANGVASSTVTITLKDANNVGVSGIVPSFSATDTGATNAYSVCSSSNGSGVSTCTLTSTKAETKTLAITSPVSVSGGTVVFVHGTASSAHSTITGTGPVEPDGVATSTITIVLEDAFRNPVNATVPTFSATGSTNTYGVCSSSDATGTSTCTLSSTTAETKTLSLSTPISFSGGTVVFAPTTVSALTSTIAGSGSVVADGVATSTVTITLKDVANVPVGGVVPNFSATNTGATNTYGTCSSSNATTGVSTCTLTSTKAETKTLQLTSPVSVTGGTVIFTAGAASAATTTITGTGSVVADGASTSTVTITLLDVHSNPISGTVPTFSATNTGAANSYGTCSSSNGSGVSTCTLSSTKAETKTLALVTPVNMSGGTVVFVHGTASAVTSTITGSGPVEPDGVTTSTITINLFDAFSNPVNGVTPTFSATDTGATNVYGACSSSSVAGVSTCTLSSTHSETKTLSLVTPAVLNGGSVVFTPGAVSALHSSISGTGSVVANGAAISTITIVLKDASNIAVVGVVPTFTATNAGSTNIYGACSSSDASGTSTCSLSSTKAQTKTLSISSPISLAGGTVTFVADVASASTSQITGTSSVVANGMATSTVTIVLYDSHNNPVVGTIPTFSATDTGGTNTYGTCSSSDATGASTCTLASTKVEVKTLTLTSPVSVSGGTVNFTAGPISASTSTITGAGSVLANGIATSTVTITLLDAQSNPVSGTVPTFTATDTGATNVYGTCSSSNASGVSTCTLKSTRAETKTLSLATPVVVLGGTVVFTQTPDAANSTIVGTGSVGANGVSTSTVTITLKDYSNIAIVGVTPTFSATDSSATNVYGACSATNASGVSTCTLKSTYAETKTLSLAAPISFSGGTVVFTQVASTSNSTITGTSSVTANGVSTSTITITINDYTNTAIAGVTPTFSATDTGSTNSYGACSSTNGSGVSTCTLSSTKAEVKTLSITSPISMSGGTVTFTAGPASASTSTIVGTGSVGADGFSASNVTIVLLDAYSNPVVGTIPTFSATNTGGSNVYGTCLSSNASGASPCTLKSTNAETKTLSIVTPVALAGGSVVFTQVVDQAFSSIVGTGSVGADASSSSTITITLMDFSNTAIVGITPTFNATDTGSTNIYAACSATNGSGVSTCGLKSSRAETKVLTALTPVKFNGGSVVFTQVASPVYSTITGTGPVTANGVSTSTITITLKDYSDLSIVGVTPTFTATNTGGGNSMSACTSSNASGVSNCGLRSTHAETKVLSLSTPISFTGGSVVFQ